MDERNKGLIVFGIVFGVIGVLLSLQRVGYYYSDLTYPYQTIGIVLVIAGIVFVALGLLYSPRKIPPPP
jgi:drug/metabolite transporter (DMT)-like permease